MSDANNFNLPQAAQPQVPGIPETPGITGRLPLPVGKPVKIVEPSPGERAVLEEFGWKEGQPIPSNLSDIIAQAKEEATNTDLMQPPAPLDTPKLQLPKEKDISELPTDQQQHYVEIVKQVLETATVQHEQEQAAVAQATEASVSGAGGGVNDAIIAAMGSSNDVELVDDREADTYATGQPKEAAEPASTTGSG